MALYGITRTGVALVLGCALFGCAGHAARTLEARTALDRRNPERALELYNEELEVESKADLPEDVSGDNALLLLDRSLILQQLGDTKLSSRDLETADKQIEFLDFSRGTTDEIGKYLFSDDTGPYRAPPYEKLMINTMNMVNYLVRGDLNGARIEARRFTVMQDYLKDKESADAALMGAGSYLAGFVFEYSNEPQTALRYYDEALQYGEFRTLDRAIVRLSARASYRTPRITEVLKRAGVADASSGGAPASSPPTAGGEGAPSESVPAESVPSTPTIPAPGAEDGEVLVILCFGRVPAKKAERVPIGLALTYAAGAISPADHSRANALAAQGLVTWVNYPTLDKARGGYDVPMFQLEGRTQNLDGVPVDKLTIAAWEEAKGTVVASAITRMIARVVAGEAARQATGDDGVGGLLISLATQATLTAADTPDTRSWSTLPARIALGRVRVPAGKHAVRIHARGESLEQTLDVRPGGFEALNLTVLR
jgi:hypothetical protein